MPDFNYSSRTVVIKDPALRQFEGGFTAIPNRILENRDLSLGARLTYSMLLKYAWQKDFCWPAQQQLGEDLGLKSRMIRYHLDELRKAELIAWKRQGLNRPNIYYILKLPDAPAVTEPKQRYSQVGPDGQYTATPEWQSITPQERQRIADKEDTRKKTKNVNVTTISSYTASAAKARQAEEEYLVSEILAVCRDAHSTGFYRKLCRTIPADVIREALSETRYEAAVGRIRTSRGAFFTASVKRLQRL